MEGVVVISVCMLTLSAFIIDSALVLVVVLVSLLVGFFVVVASLAVHGSAAFLDLLLDSHKGQ